MARILFAAYSVQITKRGEPQYTDTLKGKHDLLNLFTRFVEHIHANREFFLPRKKGDGIRQISCIKSSISETEDRGLYGYFVVGKNGEKLSISKYDLDNGAQLRSENVSADDFVDRTAFFYLHAPRRRKRAYIVLQLPGGRGIKESILAAFHRYWYKQDLSGLALRFTGLLNSKLFDSMIDSGTFKEMVFTRNGIPSNIEELGNYSGKIPIEKGVVKTVVKSSSLDWLKEMARRIMTDSRIRQALIDRGEDPSVIESDLDFDYKVYSEIAMKFHHRGKNKTFHVRKQSRTLPDIDVTDNLPDNWGVDDLLKEAKDLVESVSFKINEDDIQN